MSVCSECLLFFYKLEIVKREREREVSLFTIDQIIFFLLKNDVLVYWIYIYIYTYCLFGRWKYKIIYSPHARSMNVQIVSLSISAVGLFFIFNLTHWLQTTLYNEIEFWTDTWKKVDLDNRLIIFYFFQVSTYRRRYFVSTI